ncbi:MAG TPA: pyridoxamine 5'-phosphate oxidase family protein [Gemmatimonadaceae bacterium]|nr:pyridoxamine 5'-phosphate oxidase family protein [Gemmatimonadaceae bacterium]
MSPAKVSRVGTTAKETKPPKDGTEAERMWAARAGDVTFRDLSRDEIEAMLLCNRVGRIAFSLHDRVDIQPIHYIYERGWLYGRTSDGDKISTLEHNQWVAFEVDEVTDLFDWRSIVIHGSFWIMHPRGSPRAEELWTKAAELVSKIVPGALTESDPVAFRQTLFRIAVGDARGREAKMKPLQRNDP